VRGKYTQTTDHYIYDKLYSPYNGSIIKIVKKLN